MISFFAKHPTAANLLMLMMVVLGLSSLSTIKRETFPEFSPAYLMALVVYPGASPQDIEESICPQLEDAVDGLPDVQESRCVATESSAQLIVKLDASADKSRILVDLKTKIEAISNFPSEIESPIVQEFEWAEPVIDVAISANMEGPDLRTYVEQLKQRLKYDYGVSLVEIRGFSQRQIQVEVSEFAIRQLGLTISEITAKLAQQSFKMPSGNIKLKDKDLLLRFDARQTTIDGLGAVIILANQDGAIVRLRDIAKINETFSNKDAKIIFDGLPSATLSISKNKTEDALRIKDQVAKFVDDQRLIAPKGVHFELTNDLSSVLLDRLSMITKNGGQGIVLVFFSMWLFFSLRYSIWVAAGLPVAFIGSLFFISAFGISINIMSLVALLMAVGIMMDDAIVLSESIAAHREKGCSIDDAVIQGVKKVFPGVLSSFLTTICIFGTLIFLEGEMGKVVQVIPQVLILVLTLSLVEAFLILPHHLHHSLHKHPDEKRVWKYKQGFLNFFEKVRSLWLVNGVRRAVKHRYLFISWIVFLLFISFGLLNSGLLRISTSFDVDGDVAIANILLPAGSTLEHTEKVVQNVVAAAKEIDERYFQENKEHLLVHVTEIYGENSDAGESGLHVATVRIDLLSAERRKITLATLFKQWNEIVGNLPEPIRITYQQPAMGPGGHPFEIRISYPELAALKSASMRIQSFIGSIEGVSNVADNMRMGKEEILIQLRPGAESYGINGQIVAQQLRSAYYGQLSDEIQQGSENIEVTVMLDKKEAGDLALLSRFPIILPNGSQLPLNSIATLSFQRNYVKIRRVNGERTLTITADLDARKISGFDVMAQLNATLFPQLTKEYPGFKVMTMGQSEDMAKTTRSMMKGFMLGIFGIFVILSYQFRSYIEPFIVLLVIPLALIGVLWGHFLLGYSIGVMSLMGFVSLSGVVVNDSILLVQYIRQHVDAGESVYESVVQASKERLRAVFLTSLTTAAGLFPLLFETSLQAKVLIPLVVSIVSGILTSTLLVLFLIPVVYAILADFNLLRISASEVSQKRESMG